jgi:hypothetical protein
MDTKFRNRWFGFFSLLLILSSLLACSVTDLFASTPSSPTTAAETPAGPPPTAPTDSAALTAVAQQTQAALDASATQVAQQTQDAAAILSATKTAIAPVEVALAGLGVVSGEGNIYVADSAVTQDGKGYHQFFYSDQFPGVSGKDIAIQSDITWNSRYGDAGCGFAFRSSGMGDKPNQYMFLALRELGGYISFQVMNEGNIINRRDIFPQLYDPKFDWANGVTNRISVVVRGTKVQLFTNGIVIASLDANDPPPAPDYPEAPVPPFNKNDKTAMAEYKKDLEAYNKLRNELTQKYQLLMSLYKKGVTDLPAGYAYLVTYAGSGDVTCQFNNSFLWVSSQQ